MKIGIVGLGKMGLRTKLPRQRLTGLLLQVGQHHTRTTLDQHPRHAVYLRAHLCRRPLKAGAGLRLGPPDRPAGALSLPVSDHRLVGRRLAGQHADRHLEVPGGHGKLYR